MKVRGYLLIIFLILSLPAGKMQAYGVKGSYLTMDNEKKDFNSLSGEYIVLDAFWTNCDPCRLEMLHLENVYNTLDDEGKIVSISMHPDDTIEKIKTFKDEFDAKWTFGLDFNGTLADYFSIQYYPTTYIISPEGEILKKWIGVTDSDEILKELDKYIDIPGSFARKLNIGQIFSTLFQSSFFYIFLIMLWTFVLYSGYVFIGKFSEEEPPVSNETDNSKQS